MEVETAPQLQCPRFVNRIYTYPVVNSACEQVASAYSKVKSANKVVNAGLSFTESSLKLVATTASPLVSKLDQTVHLDDMACSQLDKLEVKLPIITKPVDEVSKQARCMVLKTVEPTIEAADKMCHNVKTKITQAEEFGKTQLAKVADCSYGQQALSKMVSALDLADQYIDYYLPEEKNTAEFCKCEDDEDKMKTAPETPVNKVVYVTAKMRRRMFQRAMKKLDSVKVRSTEAVEKMNFTIDLIAYAKNHIDNVTDKANELRQDFNYKLWELEAQEKHSQECAHLDDDTAETTSNPKSIELEKKSKALSPARLTQSLVYWSHKLSISLQAARFVVAGRVHVPQNVIKSVNLAADAARKLYQDVAALKYNDLKSLSLVKKNLRAVDTYLKYFFDVLDNNAIVKRVFGENKLKKLTTRRPNTDEEEEEIQACCHNDDDNSTDGCSLRHNDHDEENADKTRSRFKEEEKGKFVEDSTSTSDDDDDNE